MKWSLVFLLLFASVLLYSYHQSEMRRAEEAAGAEAREEARAEASAASAAEFEQQRVHRQKESADKEAKVYRPLLAITNVIAPLTLKVMGPLDLEQPEDLVPAIEITEKFVLAKRGRAGPASVPAFDRAKEALDYLARVAEERTKALEVVVKNRAASTMSMGRDGKSTTGADFFSQNVIKKWEETARHSRPTIDQFMGQLRIAENAWNLPLDKESGTELYEIPELAPLIIPVDQVAPPPYGHAPKTGGPPHPWRAPFYLGYGLQPPAGAP